MRKIKVIISIVALSISTMAYSQPQADNLDDCRKKIDEIDRQIVDLLNKRLQVTQRVGEIKRGLNEEFYVPEREKKIFQRLESFNKGPLSNASLKAIFREVISAGIAQQKALKIAYFGAEGTFTHQAALSNFGSSVGYLPYQSIQNVFAAVELNEADYGVIPIESSNEGVVAHSLDQLAHTDLKIIAQVQQNFKDNSTRFFVISRSVPGGSAEGNFRTSLLLTTKHERGALNKILEVLSEESINLLKIESRPIQGKLWEYIFFIDIEGHWLNKNIKQAMDKISPLTTSLKWLGSYPS